MMCIALSACPDLLHQHFDSVFFFVINSLLFPTHRRFSRISLIIFDVFGEQLRVLHVFLRRLISTEPWFETIFLRNSEDFVAENSS